MLGPWQLLVVALVTLLVFGTRHLGALGTMLGRSVRRARRPQASKPDERVNWLATARHIGRMTSKARRTASVLRLFR